jgi:hypothetical protein
MSTFFLPYAFLRAALFKLVPEGLLNPEFLYTANDPTGRGGILVKLEQSFSDTCKLKLMSRLELTLSFSLVPGTVEMQPGQNDTCTLLPEKLRMAISYDSVEMGTDYWPSEQAGKMPPKPRTAREMPLDAHLPRSLCDSMREMLGEIQPRLRAGAVVMADA